MQVNEMNSPGFTADVTLYSDAMNMPGFTAENSIYKTRGRYCMASAFDSQNASTNVQPARVTHQHLYCNPCFHAALAAADRGDDAWAAFWYGAWEGCISG